MISTGRKLSVALLMAPTSLVLIRLNGWFGIGFVVGIIFSILYCIDYAAELRSVESASKTQQIILLLLTVPQVLIGLGILAIGASILLWVLYNNFVERQPQFTGGFLTFGMAPLFIFFGIGLLISAFKKRGNRNNEP